MLTAAITPQQSGAGHAADGGTGSPANGFAILLQALAGGQQQATAKGTAALLATGETDAAGTPEATDATAAAAEGAAQSQIVDPNLVVATQNGDAAHGTPQATAGQTTATLPDTATTAQTADTTAATQGSGTTGPQTGEAQGQAATTQAGAEASGQAPRPTAAADGQTAGDGPATAKATETAGVGTATPADATGKATGPTRDGAPQPPVDQGAGGTQTHNAPAHDAPAQGTPPQGEQQAAAPSQTDSVTASQTAATTPAPAAAQPAAAAQAQSTTSRQAARSAGTTAPATPNAPQAAAAGTPANAQADGLPTDGDAAEGPVRPVPTQTQSANTPGQQTTKPAGEIGQTAQAPTPTGTEAKTAQTELPFAERLSAFRAMSALDPFGFVAPSSGTDSGLQLASFISEGAVLTVQQAAAPSSVELPTAFGARSAAADPGMQLAVQIHRAITANSQQFRIQLEPAELGRVDVRLNFGRDGRVRATIGVERAETLDLIQRDVQELERVLKEAGTDPNKLDLRFNLQGESHEQAAHGNETDLTVADADAETAGDADTTDLTAANSRSQRIDGLLDMHV